MSITVKQVQKVRELSNQGLSDRAIASQMGLSCTTIWCTRQDFGIPNACRAGKPKIRVTILNDGFKGTYAECSKHVGINVMAFKQRVCRHPEAYIKERICRRKTK